MCTILTVSNEFYLENKEGVLSRIQRDSAFNNDGWAMVLLGKYPDQTVVIESLDQEVITDMITSNQSWTRMFLHARAATTTSTGIFGCHNFSTVGFGRKNPDKESSHWVVQHNGILHHKKSDLYMVDSMLIADFIAQKGIPETIDYLTEYETYANVFLINPETGEYIVTRAVTGSLHTDNAGNYSSQPVGSINIPVSLKTSREYLHEFSARKATKVASGTDYVRDAIDFWKKEASTHSELMEEEIGTWGENALQLYSQDVAQFSRACGLLGFFEEEMVMSRALFEDLSVQQKRWVRSLKIEVEAKPTKRRNQA